MILIKQFKYYFHTSRHIGIHIGLCILYNDIKTTLHSTFCTIGVLAPHLCTHYVDLAAGQRMQYNRTNFMEVTLFSILLIMWQEIECVVTCFRRQHLLSIPICNLIYTPRLANTRQNCNWHLFDLKISFTFLERLQVYTSPPHPSWVGFQKLCSYNILQYYAYIW